MKTWKRWVAVKLLASLALLTTACGGAKLDGVWYDSFGLANDTTRREPGVVYEISASSVVWAVLLIETVAVPVYIVGWDLYTPIRVLHRKPQLYQRTSINKSTRTGG